MMLQKFSILISLATFGTLTSTFAADLDKPILIRNTTVVDVRNQKLLPSRDVLLAGGRILLVAPKGQASARASQAHAIEVDGSQFFITPGLIDAHVHTDLYAWEKQLDDWSIPLYLSNGITTMRDAAGSSLTLKLRKDIESGKRIGPRLVIASLFITSDDVDPGSNVVTVKTAEEARLKVTEFLNLGYDGIKCDSGLNDDAYKGAARTAEARGSYLFGHTLAGKRNGYGEIYLEETLDHYRTLEHLGFAVYDYMQSTSSPLYHKPDISAGQVGWYAGAYMDFAKAPALAQLLRSKNATLSPTMITEYYDIKLSEDKDRFIAAGLDGFRKDPAGQFLPDYYYDMWLYMYKNWSFPSLDNPWRKLEIASYQNGLKLLKILDDAGVRIIAGTDVPARPYLMAGQSLHEEMGLFRQAGFSQWRALRTSTINAAEALGLAGRAGEIRAGAFADLVVTTDSPISNPDALRHPFAVVTHGKWLSHETLAKMLADQKEIVRRIPTPPTSKGFRPHLEHRPMPGHFSAD